jgi:FMN phosphatase YigB (HAD superfamily)
VFVDDLRENVAGAETVGMAGVLHRESATTIAELESLLGVTLG